MLSLNNPWPCNPDNRNNTTDLGVIKHIKAVDGLEVIIPILDLCLKHVSMSYISNFKNRCELDTFLGMEKSIYVRVNMA